MVRLAFTGLLARRVGTLLALAGLLTATLGFVFLAGTSRTTEAVVTGDIGRAWQAPYQLLVRPPGSQTALEASEGLVRPNYLAGLANGGITDAQLAAIRAVAGVGVAAPVAVAGLTTTMRATFSVDLGPYLDSSKPIQLFKVGIDRILADAGLSPYPGPPASYVVFSASGTYVPGPSTVINGSTYPGIQVGSRLYYCGDAVLCLTGAQLQDLQGKGDPHFADSHLIVDFSLEVPMVFAGVDPAAEAQLVGLDRCVTSGRFLSPADIVSTRPVGSEGQEAPVVPILISNTSGIDETVETAAQEAPSPPALPKDRDAWNAAVSAISWQSRGGSATSLDDAYRAGIDMSSTRYNIAGFRTPGDVSYTQVGPDHLAAASVAQDLEVYASSIPRGIGGHQATLEDLVPPEARDTWFRTLTHHDFVNSNNALNGWQPIGEFDPSCVASFDPLTGFALQTYAPAVVKTADGTTLGPSRNEAGYVNPPPLLLTTLAGARYFADPSRYAGRPGDAYISVVRVKVAGVDTPSPAAEAKLARVAADIHAATGLAVDVVVGSSARPMQVDLPAGQFGRPALTVNEGWAVKGVAVRFLQAVQLQDLGIFSLVLVVAAILVAETAYLSVRRRRPQFGLLRALGWSQVQIGLLVEFEMLLLGLVAGLLALGIGMPLARLLGIDTADLQLFAAAPLAVGLSALAGLPPAIAAGRGSTRTVMVGSGPSRLTVVRSVAGLAVGDLLNHRRREALLGIGGVALASALLGGILLLVIGFAGVLDTTILGTYLSGQVRPFHLVIGALTLAVAAMAVTQVITAAYLEREADLAALRALGWPRSSLRTYLLAQAGSIGLTGGIVGGALTGAIGLVINAAPSAVGVSAGVVGLVGLLLSLAASLGPLVYAYRSRPARHLQGE